VTCARKTGMMSTALFLKKNENLKKIVETQFFIKPILAIIIQN
jgi:hypothetical protein